MTKKARKKQVEETTSVAEPRRHRRLRQKEAQTERRVIIAVGAIIGLVVVLLLAGVISEFVIKPRKAVATVNGQAISVSEFERRLRFEQDNLTNQINQYIQFGQQFGSQGGANPFQSYIEQLFEELSTPERFSLTVLDRMVEESLVRQLAGDYDVAVTEDEVQREIETQFGYDRDAEPAPTPDPNAPVTDTVAAGDTVTVEDFQANYNETIAGLGERGSVTEDEFRQQISTNLLRQKLSEAAPLEFDATEEQVNARHILVEIAQPDPVVPPDVEAEALARIEEALARIEGGEAFADVAQEVSEDTGSGAQGGDLGWFGRGRMVPEFEEAAFSLAPGELSEPIKTQFGYHIIQVDEVNEETDEIKARHILIRADAVPDENAVAQAEADALAKIEQAQARIAAGEAFADVAKALSEDTATAEEGGDLGWFANGNGRFGTEFDDLAFSLETGAVSERLKTFAGYHLIQIMGKDPAREVAEDEMETRRNTAFEDWLLAQQEVALVERDWSLDLVPELPADLQSFVDQLRVFLLEGATQGQQAPVEETESQ